MKKIFVILSFIAAVIVSLSFSKENLRSIYAQPPSQWPKPDIDEGVQWAELGILPESPIEKHKDSLKHIIELGKALFFDTRLSGSGKISCATCHQPELNWTDGKEKSIGHEGAITKRNAPTIQNTWFYNRLFWDGRSKDLQDQAFAPINSETEMHSEMHDVMRKLSKVKGYKEMFKAAFGDENIDPFVMTEAIATFEKTIVSRKSRFDEFLEGNKKALTNSELRGLHLFRTKARCMNCHNGPLFSDNQFHRTNISFNKDDEGLYRVTHKEEDKGKFKTPSLRDVMNTGPWMHDGGMNHMMTILEIYRKGPPEPDSLLKHFNLGKKESLNDIFAFLKALSAPSVPFQKPVLPE
jgi:cytochrome c peroxidase